MQHDFFRYNMPYGLQKLPSGKWMVFNRAYAPLGWTNHAKAPGVLSDETAYENLPITAKYNVSEFDWEYIVGEENIKRNSSGQIDSILLYNDRTFPIQSKEHWQAYADKLQKLAMLSNPQNVG